MIQNIVGSSAFIDEKYNIIKKCLYVLKLMIQTSEKNGTARVKTHKGLQKRKIYTIRGTVDQARIPDFEVQVYENTTMWELREIVSKKINTSVEFFKAIIKRQELKDDFNGKTITEMKVILPV